MVKMTDLLIVGGGAAGLLCGGFAARQGLAVTILEKMERPGRKLLITGKGRCNLTNNCTQEEFLAAVRTNPKFLYSAAHAFPPQKTMELFTQLDVPLKTERGGRVFPVSDRSMDIVDAMVSYCRSGGVKLVHGQAVKLLIQEGQVTGVVDADHNHHHAKKVVLATGGKSYPLTGSTGDGYYLASQAGHTIIPPRASLIPIETQQNWCREVMGLSLKNVTLTVTRQGKKKPVYQELGEMLFTHFGVSGPLVLSASAHMSGPLDQYALYIDLKPALSHQQLDARVLRDFEEQKNKDFLNALGGLLPRKLIPVLVELSDIPAQTKVHQITKTQRLDLVELLKKLPLTPERFRPIKEAVITAGGVKVGEVNPRTMESKLVKGLFFAGELLDLDAYTGGYNLQIAFSTAYLAALGAAGGESLSCVL